VTAQLQLQSSSLWLIAPTSVGAIFVPIFLLGRMEQLPKSPSADLYELFSEVFALQQPKECFWHVFDPLEHIFFEAELPRSLPIGETL
jgi:hypothetical protein